MGIIGKCVYINKVPEHIKQLILNRFIYSNEIITPFY